MSHEHALRRSFMGKGSIYIEEIGADHGLLPFGNCPELNLAISEDKKPQLDSESAGGGVVQVVSRISAITASIQALSLSPANLALALRGLINHNVGGAVSEEPHKARPGAFVPFDKTPDFTKAVTVKIGATPLVEGTDYQYKNAGILILAAGSVNATTDITVTYTSQDSFDIEGLNSASKEYRVVFDGLNEADSGKPVTVRMHRVKFNPTQALALISDEFATLPLSYDLLKDETVTGTGESQFVKITVTK